LHTSYYDYPKEYETILNSFSWP